MPTSLPCAKTSTSCARPCPTSRRAHLILNLPLSSALAALALLASGCASVSVKKETFGPGQPKTPETILVRPFAVEGLRVDREGDDLSAFTSDFQGTFAAMLAERLSKHIAPARVIGPAGPVPRANAWLIEGGFARVHQGSRALRAVVGWGLGGTKMDCTARVYDLRDARRTPLAVIETTGGSNAEPGALFGGPFGALPRLVVTSVNSGVTPDTRRTARMITAALSEYLSKGKAPLPNKPLRPKRLGEVPGLTSQPEAAR